MVLASHVIFTMYGFWLPNDPRGSWSDFVRSWEILRAGGSATKTDERRSVAYDPHDRSLRESTKKALKYEPVQLTGLQAACVGRGYARAIEESGYRVFSCSIMPDHSHLVVERHERDAERIIGHLKARATQALIAMGMHPFASYRGDDGTLPSMWTHRGWKVFLSDETAIRRAIEYVEENPVKEGKRRQSWKFVTPLV